MRIYYDREGRRVGYALPAWLVVIKWAILLGLLVWPAYALGGLLGIGRTATAVLALIWLALCFVGWRALKRNAGV